MKIDKEKINKSVYKDKDGNILKIGNGWDGMPEGTKYKTYFDATFTEKEYVFQKENECKHENITTIINSNGSIKQKCENCRGTRELDNEKGWTEWYVPSSVLLIESHSTWNEELAMAMANSGDYTLREAIYILGKSCERCINVLYKKYLPDKNDGYEEFSDEWKKAGTICEFCKHLGLSHDNYLKNKRKRIENIIKEEREKYDTDEFFLANVIEKLNEELRREGRENLSFVFMQQVDNKHQFGIQFKNKEVEILLNRFFNLNEILLFDDYLFKICGYNREKYIEESEGIVYYDESIMENPEWFYIDSMNPVPKEKNGKSNEEICKEILDELHKIIKENRFIIPSYKNKDEEFSLDKIIEFTNKYLKARGFKYIDVNDSIKENENSYKIIFTFRKDDIVINLSENLQNIEDVINFNEEKFIELNYNIDEYKKFFDIKDEVLQVYELTINDSNDNEQNKNTDILLNIQKIIQNDLSNNSDKNELLNTIIKNTNELLRKIGFKYIDISDSKLIDEKSIDVRFTFRKDDKIRFLSKVLDYSDIMNFNEEAFIELDYDIVKYIDKYCENYIHEEKKIEVNDSGILFGSINKRDNELKYKINTDSIEDGCITENDGSTFKVKFKE